MTDTDFYDPFDELEIIVPPIKKLEHIESIESIIEACHSRTTLLAITAIEEGDKEKRDDLVFLARRLKATLDRSPRRVDSERKPTPFPIGQQEWLEAGKYRAENK